ncbi:metallophosphoesterase family protein [Mycobacterium intracellulare]|nr:metallophosphoesterase family protein [Mycobacterium intracellulare]MCA2305806.1 metallophosphoesterase family protein [Mycobacterium intracellulare]MCA2347957.1 metallophosphoesterase family protein [Mycobacterium intracellulare]
MRIAVFSDVHGNLVALQQFVAATAGRADAYLCLGDVVNYGPWNDECIDLVLSLPGIRVVEGNHERLFRGDEVITHEIPLVQDFYRHSRPLFSRDRFLTELLEHVDLGIYHCTHTIDDRRIYPDTEIEIDRHYMIGHTHHQYQIERSGFTIVNPGSIGQNRKWIDSADFLILDTTTGEIQFESIPYDVDYFLAALKWHGYPEPCIQYYSNKARKFG